MFEVLHSSAGAGKTHALVKHYLLLCLRSGPEHGFSPQAYRHVLALTFTNKAAGEMRERIIGYLGSLSHESELSVPLQDVRDGLMASCGITPEEVRKRAADTLEHMLHHWPQVAVSTIDAFTRRVVMPFARDLRLDHDLQMTTEEEHYRSKAVDLLLEEAGQDPVLTPLLVAICRQLLDEEKSWRPDRPLLQLSKQLGNESALDHLRQLRALGHEQFLAIQQRLRLRTTRFRERIRTLGRTALDTLERAGIAADHLAFGKNGVHGLLRKMAAFEDRLDMNKNALKSLGSGKWHSAKVDPATRSNVDAVASLLSETLHAVIALEADVQQHVLAVAVLRELMPTAALHALDERLERIRSEEGIAFFSDLTRKVADIVQHEPAPFLFERLGERYHHILIDEFQDTSVMQWHALLPLLENALTSTDHEGRTGSALLVGDAKQAIYRFRNGEARQFVELPRLFARHKLAEGENIEAVLVRSNVPRAPLNGNFRSGSAIIRSNNELFGALRHVLLEVDRTVYHRHEQDPRRELEGLVEIACLAKEEDVDPALEFTRERVQHSLDDGFGPEDIAVLIRTKTQGRRIAAHLVEQGWNVVSPDGLSLADDLHVGVALAILAWLDRPDDQRAAIAVQQLARLHPEDGTARPFPSVEPPRTTMRRWAEQHPELGTKLPLFALVHRILVALGVDPTTDAFAMGLLQEVHGFAVHHADPPGGFLEHWARVGRQRSAFGTSSAAIRIMTVHASKGLQFPVVIVPWANMDTRGAKDERIWVDATSIEPELPAAMVRFQEPVRSLPLPEVELEERQRRLDLLNLLYVAFTRPEQRLYAAVEASGKDPIMQTLRDHLQLSAGESWTAGTRAPRHGTPPKAPPPSLSLYTGPGHGIRQLAIRKEAPDDWDPADPDPFRSRGRAIHAVLARVHTAADLPDAMAKEPMMLGMPAEERDRIAHHLQQLLTAPAIAPYFTSTSDVITEATMITAEGRALRPDRIVRDATGTHVIDIKTGAPSDTHQEQVINYARLLQALDGGPVTAHLLYLKEGLLIDVGPWEA